jgi:hypothetical protein
MRSLTIPLAVAAAVALVAAPAADAKKKPRRTSATYDVVIKAAVKESWSFRDFWSYDCLDGMCTRDEQGSGTMQGHLGTRRPFPVWVSRGLPGRPVLLNQGSDGIPMRGGWLRSGAHTTEYSGAWDAANPDTTESVAGCGHKSTKPFAILGWDYEKPTNLHLTVETEPLRDCPDGPPSGLEWDDGDGPALGDVLAHVGRGKFLGTKQFSVRGSHTWHGTVTPFNRTDPLDTKVVSGEKTVTWQWTATFRMRKGR